MFLAVGGVFYAFRVEPFWVQATHHEFSGPVPRVIKIAHLSDIHSRGWSRREASILSLIAAERPHLIVITGDCFTDRYESQDFSLDFLKELKAPLGVWAVRGNWEIWRPADNEPAFYEEAGVNFLLNQSSSPLKGFSIVGLDDPWSGKADLPKALKGVPPNNFRLVLFHAPAFFDRTNEPFQLALAGHTHGGQVRIPFMKPLILPEDSGRFVQGWYESHGAQMYVSRGIGTSLVQARFLCRPEVAFITLKPKS